MIRFKHLLRDTGIYWEKGASLLNCQFELTAPAEHMINRHPTAIYYPPVCKACFALVKFDCRCLFRLQCKWFGTNMANACCVYTEKFSIEVAYREMLPQFWDSLISRYRPPMTYCGQCVTFCVIAVAFQSIRNLCKSKRLIFTCKLLTERDHRTRLRHMSLNKN